MLVTTNAIRAMLCSIQPNVFLAHNFSRSMSTPAIKSPGLELSVHGFPFPAGTSEADKIDILRDEVYVHLKDYKHKFLGHGSNKEVMTGRASEPFHICMSPLERGVYKDRARWLKTYLENVISWAGAIDEALKVASGKQKASDQVDTFFR
jgi:hypothetical protein